MHVKFREARRILFCGGRDFNDFMMLEKIFMAMGCSNRDDYTFMHGGATGADHLCAEYAKKFFPKSTILVFPANWRKLGRAAGPIRNTQMLRDGCPEWVMALPGGKGTENMITQALQAYVPVMRFYRKKDYSSLIGGDVQAEYLEPAQPLDDTEYAEIMASKELEASIRRGK